MNLQTSFMGVALKNPLIAGASSLTGNIDSLKKIEAAGAGAVVLKSLFEEQIQLERFEFDEQRDKYDTSVSPEINSFFPHILEHGGAKAHLLWIREVKSALSIPVFASINAQSTGTWVEYARSIAETGVDGIEMNIYSIPPDERREGCEIEREQIDAVREVASSVSLPISVKMTPHYSNPLNIAAEFSRAGAQGLVLFNRMFQPNIDIEREKLDGRPYLSTPDDSRISQRFTGLLFGNVKADLCASRGIMRGNDAISALLAGASCFQTVSALYRNGIAHIGPMLDDIGKWMEQKGYSDIGQLRGKLSKQQITDPWAYQRAQYINILWRANQIMEGKL